MNTSNIENDYKVANDIGKQFIQVYFAKEAKYFKFFGNDSFLTFESEIYYGVNNIINKLNNVKLNCNYTNYEIQPSVGGILIFISGTCCVEGETNAIPFMRVLFLANSNGSYYVKNDIYKITLG